MNLALFLPALYGLLFGGIISYYYSIHSIKTASEYSLLVLGMDSSYLIKVLVVVTAGFIAAILAAFSAMIRDLEYPKTHPIEFTIETVLAGLLPALLILLINYFLEIFFTIDSFFDFIIVLCKGALFHILLQFSGVYRSVFSK